LEEEKEVGRKKREKKVEKRGFEGGG